MKKSILAIVVLLLTTTFIVNAEVVQVVTGTATPTGTSFTFTASGQTIHYQFVYPASLFTDSTDGKYTRIKQEGKNVDISSVINFEYIDGIKLYANWNLPSDVNNLGFTIVAKAMITSQNDYSDSVKFIDVSGAKTFYSNAGTVIGKISIDPNNNIISLQDTVAPLAINTSNNDNVVIDLQLTANFSQLKQDTTITIQWKDDNSKSSAAIITTTGFSTNDTTVNNFLPQTDFTCGRVIKNVRQQGTIYTATYDLRTKTSGDFFEATLLSLSLESSPKFANYQLTYSYEKSPDSRPDSILHGNTLTLNSVNFKDAKVNANQSDIYPIFIIGNNAFNKVSLPCDLIIELPTTVRQLGDNNSTDNKCFYVTSIATLDEDNNPVYTHYYVTFYLNSYPTIVGLKTDTITHHKVDNRCPGQTNLVFINSLTGKYDSVNTWTKTIRNQFTLFKYSSPLYDISFENDYDLNATEQKVSGQDIVYAIKYPYNATYPLEFTFDTTKAFRSFDGTDHYFNGFNNVSFTGSTGTQTISGSTLTCTLSGKCKLSIVSKFNARLEYQSGTKDQTLDANALTTYATNDRIWLSRANNLVFGRQAENKSPEFEYTNTKNNTDAPTYLTTTTPIYVEKIIDNEQYQFFSMPFDVNVEDIVVTYDSVCQKDNNGKWKSNPGNWAFNKENDVRLPLSLLTSDFANLTTGLNVDSYVIYEYTGQKGVNGEKATYKQVTSGTLHANKGYAFVIVENDNNYYRLNWDKVENDSDYVLKYKVMATIKFKDARGDGQKNIYMNTYTGFKYTAASSTRGTTGTGIPASARVVNDNDSVLFPILFSSATTSTIAANRNWNLVGNPFLHTVNSAAFGKYVTTIGADNTNTNQKQFTERHVAHRSVYDTKEIGIQPFQAFFIQAVGADSTNLAPIEIDPTATGYGKSQNSGSNAPAYAPMTNRPEVISLNILLRDTVNDFTAVINANSRGKEFKIGDDLGKMFNPCAQICTYLDSTYCSFKELDIRNNATLRTIPLGVRIAEEGDYTFAIDTTRHYFYGAVMLHDKQMNQYYNLTVQGTQFHLTKGMDVQRFELVVEPSELPSDVETVETSETLDAYVFDGKLVVDNIVEGSTLSIFDASGRMLYTTDAAGSFNYQFSAHGVYVVVLQGNTTGSVKVVY